MLNPLLPSFGGLSALAGLGMGMGMGMLGGGLENPMQQQLQALLAQVRLHGDSLWLIQTLHIISFSLSSYLSVCLYIYKYVLYIYIYIYIYI